MPTAQVISIFRGRPGSGIFREAARLRPALATEAGAVPKVALIPKVMDGRIEHLAW